MAEVAAGWPRLLAEPGRRTVANWKQNTLLAELRRAGPCSIESAGRGLQEAVGTARGAAPHTRC